MSFDLIFFRFSSAVLQLLEAIVKLPQNWLSENVASLLFYSGDDITYDYFMAKIQSKITLFLIQLFNNCLIIVLFIGKAGRYSEVAQTFVYLTLVSYKLQNKETKCVYFLIERFQFEHKIQLYNEIPVAFCEAITEVENQMDLEDERDVTEVNLLIEANNSLLKNFMFRPEPFSSQESKCSLYSSQSSVETEE